LEKYYYVYLLASKRNGTLYVGVTKDLAHRVGQHKSGEIKGFTRTYGVDRLMRFETHTSVEAAMHREKQLKAWKREWKIALFVETNPRWDDLYPSMMQGIWP
jgi:putative endonuclease